MPKGNPMERVTFSAPSLLMSKLDMIAERRWKSRPEMIRFVLEEFLLREEEAGRKARAEEERLEMSRKRLAIAEGKAGKKSKSQAARDAASEYLDGVDGKPGEPEKREGSPGAPGPGDLALTDDEGDESGSEDEE